MRRRPCPAVGEHRLRLIWHRVRLMRRSDVRDCSPLLHGRKRRGGPAASPGSRRPPARRGGGAASRRGREQQRRGGGCGVYRMEAEEGAWPRRAAELTTRGFRVESPGGGGEEEAGRRVGGFRRSSAAAAARRRTAERGSASSGGGYRGCEEAGKRGRTRLGSARRRGAAEDCWSRLIDR